MSRYIGAWERLKDIAGELQGDLKLVYVKDSYGRDAKRIIIEYEEDSCKE
tara:strand:- start:138 stop:287 length:150 start_codon:yes stop_codon:yes gene_type:complete